MVREFDRGTRGRFLRKAVPRHGGGGVGGYAFTLHAAHRKPSLQPVFDLHRMAQRILKIEGKFWYEAGLRNLSKSIFSPPDPPPPGSPSVEGASAAAKKGCGQTPILSHPWSSVGGPCSGQTWHGKQKPMQEQGMGQGTTVMWFLGP